MKTVNIEGNNFIVSGRLLQTLNLKDELLNDIGEPDIIIQKINKQKIPCDILSFTQQIIDTKPKFKFHMEWDNAAAISITNYDEWFTKQIHPNTRNKIRKAQRSGIDVKIESISRRLAEGISEVFNETPIRRGKPYSYYGRDVDTVENEWSQDTGHNDFLVAYYKGEVIGFIQLVYGKHAARTSGTVAKIAHRNKAPMNALFSKAVEVCADKKIPYLIYGKYVYRNKDEDSLTSFKRKNGFKRVDLPRFYIPLTLKGKLAITCNLHKGVSEAIPQKIIDIISQARSLWHRFAG